MRCPKCQGRLRINNNSSASCLMCGKMVRFHLLSPAGLEAVRIMAGKIYAFFNGSSQFETLWQRFKDADPVWAELAEKIEKGKK